MSPKEIQSLVLERAKHGALIDRCGRIVYYIVLSVGFVWAAVPFPIEYFTVVTLGVPFGLVLLALAIFEWLKRRLITDEEMPTETFSERLKAAQPIGPWTVQDPPVTPEQKISD